MRNASRLPALEAKHLRASPFWGSWQCIKRAIAGDFSGVAKKTGVGLTERLARVARGAYSRLFRTFFLPDNDRHIHQNASVLAHQASRADVP